MIAIVLIGITIDRAALTLRNLALAALAVMLVAPESVVHPSFQMSFAATLALFAVYEPVSANPTLSPRRQQRGACVRSRR